MAGIAGLGERAAAPLRARMRTARREAAVRDSGEWVVVGLDNGGTTNNATVLDSRGRYLVDRMVEAPSCVREGPDRAIAALADALDNILLVTGVPRSAVRAVGLDTPGPVSADGVIASAGATNFSAPEWRGFDVRGALESRLAIPVVYNNDANAAALYAHHAYFPAEIAPLRSSVSVIIGTGLGGGVIEAGQIVRGAAGMAGELGHVPIPMDGLLVPGQRVPACNCGLSGDAESVASLTAIEKNLLPYWLGVFPDHELAGMEPSKAAKLVRGYGEAGDPLALKIFEQQAIAVGRLLTIAANFTDPHAYFLGGGVVDAAPHFRDWFLARVREHTILREEQARASRIALVPDLDMAGARGSAIAARAAVLHDLVLHGPAPQKPALQKPAIREPVLQEPALQEPALQEPALQEPALQEPALQESGLKQSALQGAATGPAADGPVLPEPPLPDAIRS
jgi:glucokinase